MAIEIERKFLLANDDWRDSVTSTHRIVQGYLGGTKASVRIRIIGDQANINIKSREKGTTRLEYEYPIALTDAEEMMARLVEPGAIEKLRHLIPAGDVTWEIDEFSGANQGLVVAEVELVAADQVVVMPSWAGREVTDDERYYNVYLSRHPFNTWGAQ